MNYDEIKQLLELFEQSDLSEMELSGEKDGIRFTRGIKTGKAAGAAQAETGADMTFPSLDALQDLAASVKGTQAGAAAPENNTASVMAKEGTIIKAPIVGTFYAGSAPDQPPFVKEGDTIAEGDTLCIIEAMKYMNEVPSEKGGKIAEIYVKDGDFVEFGQPLFRII